MIQHNVGLLERVIRVILGAIAILIGTTMAASLPGWAVGVLDIVGVVLILTGFIGYCPLFAMLGINTCEECRVEEKPKPAATAARGAPAKRAAAKKTVRKATRTAKAAKKTAKKTTKTAAKTKKRKSTTKKTTSRKTKTKRTKKR